MTIRPRRSVLYMPGSNARALEKAKTLPADGVILDLEDAVAPDAKAAAREQVVAAVKAGGFGPREVFIRINGLDTPWTADDLTACCTATPDAILIPKVSDPEQLQLIAARLTARAESRSLPVIRELIVKPYILLYAHGEGQILLMALGLVILGALHDHWRFFSARSK